jgi:lysophospholipase L1-like esterase
VGGNNTAMARARFEAAVLQRNPRLVIIQFGINDSAVDVWAKPPATAPRVPLAAYRDNLRYFVDTLKARGAAVILMTPNALRWTPKLKEVYGKPPYNPDDPDGFNLNLREYAQAVRDIAGAGQVPLVDVYAAYEAYAKEAGRSPDDLLLDGMHPNARGHQLVLDLLLPRVAAALGP